MKHFGSICKCELFWDFKTHMQCIYWIVNGNLLRYENAARGCLIIIDMQFQSRYWIIRKISSIAAKKKIIITRGSLLNGNLLVHPNKYKHDLQFITKISGTPPSILINIRVTVRRYNLGLHLKHTCCIN